MPSITMHAIHELLGLDSAVAPLPEPLQDERVFLRVAGFHDAAAGDILFAEDEAALAEALGTAAGLVLVPVKLADPENPRLLGVKRPKYAFALIGGALAGPSVGAIHASAVVESGATIGKDTSVGAGTVIQAGAVVGAACEIGHNVTIHAGVTLGDRCVIQANAVLGSTGFGYVTGPDGRHVRFPQQGTLWIGNDVEIGAGCTIDRGALGETRIGRGSKLDNLVHIAHNCRIGEDVLIAAQVGMAGSCVIEDGAMLGGQVGLGERVTIGAGVMLGGQGGVLPGKTLSGKGEIFWGTPARPVREYLRDLARMRRRS